MKKIALVFPKSTFLETPLTWMPLGLMYIGAQLERRGYRCDFFDLNEDSLPADGEYEQLWVSSTSPQIMETKRIAQETLAWTKTKRILGGAGSWASPDSHKEIPYDLIVGGESDSPESIDLILDAAQDPKQKYIMPPISKTLDWVVPPLRRWAEKYHSYMPDNFGNTYRVSSMFTSRGCGKSCAFCESGRLGVIWDRLVRNEPMDVVEYQIKEIKEQGFTGIGMYDDILPANKKRTIAMTEVLTKYKMAWRCFLRTDIICHNGGYEYLKIMRDSGLFEVFIGVESASNRIKDNITKGNTIEQDAQVIEWCKQLGIRCKTSFILGLPGESLETIQETRRWILEHRPDRVQVGRLIPFAGTPLYKHPENYDLTYERQVDDEWFYAGKHDMDTHSFVSTSHLTSEQIDVEWRKIVRELQEEGIPT
jgi:radical SAM superfamily enzyme YgiQ (UPF0313 family)